MRATPVKLPENDRVLKDYPAGSILPDKVLFVLWSSMIISRLLNHDTVSGVVADTAKVATIVSIILGAIMLFGTLATSVACFHYKECVRRASLLIDISTVSQEAKSKLARAIASDLVSMIHYSDRCGFNDMAVVGKVLSNYRYRWLMIAVCFFGARLEAGTGYALATIGTLVVTACITFLSASTARGATLEGIDISTRTLKKFNRSLDMPSKG